MNKSTFANRIMLIALLAVFSSFVMSPSMVATRADSDDFRWRGKLKSGATLQIKGYAGLSAPNRRLTTKSRLWLQSEAPETLMR